MVPGQVRGGNGELLFHRYRVSVLQGKKVPETDGGSGYALNATELYT